MKQADRIVAVVLILVGIGVAWKSTELPIGILPKEGPGGGFFPFWLSMGIVVVSLCVLAQSVFSRTPRHPSASIEEDSGEKIFITWEGLIEIVRVGLPGLIMILLIGLISIYFAAAAFIFYSLYFVGRHKFFTSILVTVGVPFGVYCIFEKFLIIPLPKGYLEFLFYWS